MSGKITRIGLALLLAALGLLISTPAYNPLPPGLALAYRFGLPVLWLILLMASYRVNRLKPFRSILVSFLGVSLGIGLAWLAGGLALNALGISVKSAQGMAIAKLTEEVIPICGSIVLVSLLARQGLKSLQLQKGRFWLSIGLALLASIPILIFYLASGSLQSLQAFSGDKVLSWIPWILLFSFGNGFMEELWFRGSWLGSFTGLVGPIAASHVTSWTFAIWHVINYWNQPITLITFLAAWLYMGYIYAFIVRKTQTLWGVVLSHAIADILFLLGAFASGQMI